MATRLPTGDVLLHVTADLVAPDGRRVEGRGVVPDEPAPLRREELLAGRDAALEAAIRWIGGQRCGLRGYPPQAGGPGCGPIP
jgi:carboxyl-terminal processing protease